MFLNVFTSYLIWARHCRDNLFVPVSGRHHTFGLAESRPDLDLQQSGRLWFFLRFFLQRSASGFFPSSSTAYLADMNGQKKGGCGHFMAEWDQHASCPACCDCVFPDRPCPVCLAFTPEQRDLASSARRLRLQRQRRKAARAGSLFGGSLSGTAGSWEGDDVGRPIFTSVPTVPGQGGEEDSVASRPRQIDESGASPRPKGSRVESRSTYRPRSRDSSASSRSPPRDVGRHARHSSPDSVVGQDEAVMPECRSRPRSRHGQSTGDRRSSVDRRATGRPAARSTGGRSPEIKS